MRMWKQSILLAVLVAATLLPARLNAADTNAGPSFQEVYSLVRSNLTGVDEAELDQIALEGLLSQLQGKVAIVTNVPPAEAGDPNAPLVSTNRVFEGVYGYLRVDRVNAGLADQFKTVFQQLNSSNKLSGLVLDLRFAAGKDYASAMAVADQFVQTEKAVLMVGDTTLRSSTKDNPIRLPVAVLVNQKTKGAAEALAGVLRRNNVALIIGGKTAGDVVMFQEFPLSNGRRLRVASSLVRYGDGQTLPSKGIKPDIMVDVSPDTEKAYLEDPYKLVGGSPTLFAADSGTNRPAPRLINEAELVRRHREGLSSDETVTD
ncbi:MAG: hypothetical protein HYZ36_09080, partial [Pedosphaera parvula]|nr:hypothetical protein [Pedosphaera parvula]